MNDTAISNITSQQERDWAPLHALLGTDRTTERGPRYFMFMGFAKSSTGEQIHLFKHSNTRRYLNIDRAGQCYQFCGRGYAAITCQQAIQWAFS